MPENFHIIGSTQTAPYAAIAHNSVHGLAVQPPTSSAKTILRTTYQAPVQAHVVRDYITSHPRIFLPVLFFLLGTLTYTVSASPDL